MLVNFSFFGLGGWFFNKKISKKRQKENIVLVSYKYWSMMLSERFPDNSQWSRAFTERPIVESPEWPE